MKYLLEFLLILLYGGSVRAVRPQRWPQVVEAIKRDCRPDSGLADAARALRRYGLWVEALVIEDLIAEGSSGDDEGIIASKRRQPGRQSSCGTAIPITSDFYPSQLRQALGASAPPLLWVDAPLPSSTPQPDVLAPVCLAPGCLAPSSERQKSVDPKLAPCRPSLHDVGVSYPAAAESSREARGTPQINAAHSLQPSSQEVPLWIGGVGCRNPERWAEQGISEVILGLRRMSKDRPIVYVSGGARGCDQLFMSLALGHQDPTCHHVRGWEFLPQGLAQGFAHSGASGRASDATRASCFWANEPFSGQNAMVRNRLIYGASHITLVFSARFKEGGTWGGAINALRQRMPVAVLRPPALAASTHRQAFEALVSLGAIPFGPQDDLVRTLTWAAAAKAADMPWRDQPALSL